ncbi:MAG TPA: ammonium transporter [Candidatus Bathyarchaeia archaeon]|nr:ammonium transporter [Candidatus Bathyarchaeia archaeon]
MISATALVMLMTPALAFFYGGLVRQKNLVSTLSQCLAIFAVVSLVWALWGYSLAFAPSVGGVGVIGDLSLLGLNGVSPSMVNPSYSTAVPELLYFAFQLKFAAITPALIIGAFAERIKFKSLLIFMVLWSTLIYSPISHWVWGEGGWLRTLGAIDFAGGTVVHITAGLSALAAALVIGKRKDLGLKEFKPNNIPFVILGAGLLWFGWFGFNAGSALAANDVAVSALVVTNLSAAAAAVSWMAVDWVKKGKPSAVGIAVGSVCGLVAITPASGYVGVPESIVIGLLAGVFSNLVANWRGSRRRFDDTLDVFACHGVSGIWGSIATGLFASTAVNPSGPNGLFFGNPIQLALQVEAVAVVMAVAFFGSYILLKVINRVSPLRVTADEEERGLDVSQHGEEAYSEE